VNNFPKIFTVGQSLPGKLLLIQKRSLIKVNAQSMAQHGWKFHLSMMCQLEGLQKIYSKTSMGRFGIDLGGGGSAVFN
jgi:hypothetical protein